MKLELMAVAAALCLAAGPAFAQQAIRPVPGPGSNLLRSCNALTAQSNCALGVRPNQGSSSSGSLMGQSNTLMNQSGGLDSMSLPRASGALGTTGPSDNLSRGISNGFVGNGRTSDPLGIDSDGAFRSLSNGTFGAHSSLGGFGRSGAAGPLGGESNRLR